MHNQFIIHNSQFIIGYALCINQFLVFNYFNHFNNFNYFNYFNHFNYLQSLP